VVEPAAMGILDDKHRVFVNYETYYMSSKAAMGEFRKSRDRKSVV